MRKILKVFGIIFLLLFQCACTSKEETTSEYSIASEPITLDWYINYNWFVNDWGSNEVSKKITEETGVSVNFITPIGSSEEKLNALINANDLPDILTLSWTEYQILTMIENEMIYPLNELANEYDTHFFEIANPDVLKWYEQPDGNVYCYPNSVYTYEDFNNAKKNYSNQTFLVRKDIYEEIGSPDMSTTEGFYNAIKTVAQKYSSGSNEDLIMVGATEFDEGGCDSFDVYLQNFLNIPYEKDGEFYDGNTDEEYIRWLKLFRKLCEENYISKDIFVDQRPQISEKVAEGKYFCLLYQRTDIADQQKELFLNDPNRIYEAVEGPKNINGSSPALPTTGISGWTVTMISKKCKNPDIAIKFMDYLMSEHGQCLISLGVEGKTYDVIGDKAVMKPHIQQLLKTDRGTYDKNYGADDTYWMLQNNTMQEKWMPEYEEPLLQMKLWTQPYAVYTGQYDMVRFNSSEEQMLYLENSRLWSDTLKKLLLSKCDEDFDKVLNEYREEREQIHFSDLQKIETAIMEQNKMLLGIDMEKNN